MVLAVVAGIACAPAPAPTAFDVKAALDKSFSDLPDDRGLIAPAVLSAQIETAKPFIVEVREPREIAAAGYIAGSVHISIRTLMKNLDRLPPQDQPIVVTCGSGHRSALGMEALRLLGYTNVKSLAGGVGAWKAAQLPVATGTPRRAVPAKRPT